jgi:hypothetical protein
MNKGPLRGSLPGAGRPARGGQCITDTVDRAGGHVNDQLTDDGRRHERAAGLQCGPGRHRGKADPEVALAAAARPIGGR